MIITKGYGVNTLITQGYGGSASEFIREVLRLASVLTRNTVKVASLKMSNTLTSAMKKVDTMTSAIYNDDVMAQSSLKRFFINTSFIKDETRQTITREYTVSLITSSIMDEVSKTSSLSRRSILSSTLDREPAESSSTDTRYITKTSAIDLEEI